MFSHFVDIAALDVVGLAVIPDQLNIFEKVLITLKLSLDKVLATSLEIVWLLDNLWVVGKTELFPRYWFLKIVGRWVIFDVI